MYKKIILALVLSSTLMVHAADVIVQIGSFRNAQFASQQSAKAALMGVRTNIVESRLSTGTYYRVRTRPMTPAEAEQVVQKLRSNDIPAMVVSQ